MSKSLIVDIPTPGPKDKRLIIPSTLMEKLHAATRLCRVEISMLGFLKVNPDGLVLTRLHTPYQVVGSAHAQINPQDIMHFQSSLINEGLITPDKDDGFIRFAWHSHVDMPAIMSSTDRETFSRIGGNGTKFDPPWWISMVMNRSGAYQVIYDQWQPIRVVSDVTDRTLVNNLKYSYRDLIDEIRSKVTLGRQTVTYSEKETR
jgi:proteasome lid subunit RPN8/RPN11